MKRKALLISICYIIGTIGGLYLDKNIILLFYLILIIYLLCSYKNIAKVLVVLVVILSSIISLKEKAKISSLSTYENKKITIEGKVIGCVNTKYQKKYTVRLSSIDHNKIYKNYVLYVCTNKKIDVGCKVKVLCNIEQPDVARNYHGFDYKKFLLSKKILGSVDNANITVISSKNSDYLLVLKSKVRLHAKEVLYRYLPQKNASLCETLIFGTKSNLDEGIVESFNESSLSYILAISGMHVSFLVSVIMILLSFIKKSHSYFLIIIVIFIYFNMVESTESVLRACIMISIFYLSKIFHTKSDSITSLSISALIILVENPFYIYSAGFVMSVIGTLSIIIFYNEINKRIKKCNTVVKYILSQINLCISANILLLPIVIEKYNTFSILFLISGHIASILLSAVIPLIIIFFVTNLISISLTKLISRLLIFATNLLLYVSEIFSNITFGKVYMGSQPTWNIIIYYLLCMIILIRAKSNARDKKILGKILKAFVIFYVCLSVINLGFSNLNRKLTIHFIDVGQGDSALVITPNNKRIIIDGGGDDSENNYVGNKVLLPYLLSRGISRIDYAIISHFDTDHVKRTVCRN